MAVLNTGQQVWVAYLESANPPKLDRSKFNKLLEDL